MAGLFFVLQVLLANFNGNRWEQMGTLMNSKGLKVGSWGSKPIDICLNC